MDDDVVTDVDDMSAEEMAEAMKEQPVPKKKRGRPKKETEPTPVAEEQDEENQMLGMIKSRLDLPSEEEREKLKQQFGELTVIPLVSDSPKIRAVIVRPLNRSEWRAAETSALKTAESNPNVNAEELFRDKVVEMAIVWPSNVSRLQFDKERAGFVPSIHAVVSSLSWFFDPAALLNMTFSL